MPTVTVYYQKCPQCGATWSAQLSQERVTRIGKDVFVCKCGTEWPTGRVEWAHLSPSQRRSYFVSTAEVGVLVICTFLPALFGYFVGLNRWAGLLKGLSWGLVTGVVFVLILWAIKLIIVATSVRRRPLSGIHGPLLETIWGSLGD